MGRRRCVHACVACLRACRLPLGRARGSDCALPRRRPGALVACVPASAVPQILLKDTEILLQYANASASLSFYMVRPALRPVQLLLWLAGWLARLVSWLAWLADWRA